MFSPITNVYGQYTQSALVSVIVGLTPSAATILPRRYAPVSSSVISPRITTVWLSSVTAARASASVA